jgi:manganese/zinc/iron transport system permease protein
LAFESVGAILIIALLVGPGACALLLSINLKTVLVLAVAIGALCVFLGYLLAFTTNGSIAGAISVIIGLFYASIYSYIHIKENKRRAPVPFPIVLGNAAIAQLHSR